MLGKGKGIKKLTGATQCPVPFGQRATPWALKSRNCLSSRKASPVCSFLGPLTEGHWVINALLSFGFPEGHKQLVLLIPETATCLPLPAPYAPLPPGTCKGNGGKRCKEQEKSRIFSGCPRGLVACLQGCPAPRGIWEAGQKGCPVPFGQRDRVAHSKESWTMTKVICPPGFIFMDGLPLLRTRKPQACAFGLFPCANAYAYAIPIAIAIAIAFGTGTGTPFF